MTDTTERILQVMAHLGLSRLEFSKALGMPNQTRFRQILNEGKIPQPYDLERISFVFPQINIDWLFDGGGEMLRPIPPSQTEHNRGIGSIGRITGGVNSFHSAEGKDKVIETQEQQIFRMFEAFMEELRGFHGYVQRQDDYIKRQDEHLDNIVKKSYLRNERNMERMDKDRERLDKLIDQQNQLIRIIDRQDQKVQERADRMFDLWEKPKS